MSRKRSRLSSEEEMSSKLSDGGCGEGQNGSDTSITSATSQAPIDALQVSTKRHVNFRASIPAGCWHLSTKF
ncbi:unnamed protein product [Spodoptera littoralis]|uniref:Uncharacterized protein n=1 Tax=Spodoptera littoralis TaxID=7109 RepID=A0A9P0I905_SPOLI|nr:unnamed protein product [Spodoptera littoralis]CAH1643269.1 unnamed protein product [Spodoptera littoralis]